MRMCRECGEWHCVCALLKLMQDNAQEWRDAMREHHWLCAQRDTAFQAFMGKVLNGRRD